MLGIDGVWRCLPIDAECIDSNFDGVYENRDRREKAMERDQNALDKENEHAQDGDYEVELCQTERRVSIAWAATRSAETYKLPQTRGTVTF